MLYGIHFSLQLPSEQRVSVGEELRVELNIPKQILNGFSVHVQSNNSRTLQYKGSSFKSKTFTLGDSWPVAASPGTVNLQLRLFGVIPLKNMVVDVLPQYKVVPGGQSIGVLLKSKGILVVGYSAVESSNGPVFPAKEAGLKIGDIIISIDGKGTNTEEDTAKIIDQAGKKDKNILIKVKRNKEIYDFKVKPVYCNETDRYRIGLYIRDNAAGVGTLTFYDPKSELYGALGHVVSNGDTDQEVDLENGKIVEATIQGIQQGKKGYPGEKIGIFLDESGLSGVINKNTKYGIFGRITRMPRGNSVYNKPIPVAFASQIREGPAKMLTVVDGNKIDQFDIEIVKVMPLQQASGKGLVIRVTDKRLIKLTGGIIQGMSGSHIIQNGRLVGAVTHVFINDPTQGYGVLAEWMLLESGVMGKEIISRKISVDFSGYLSFFIKFSLFFIILRL